jgi:cytoskeleton protein RodZ
VNVEETDSPPRPESAPEPADGLAAVGSRLAAARQQQKLDLKTVASQLHLTTAVVTALEAGDRSMLPAMTFVRGYIKGYARLLGLDEQQVLGLIPAGEFFQPAPLRAVGLRSSHRRQPIGKWVLWLPVLAVLATLVVYGIPLAERLWSRSMEVGTSAGANALQLPDEGTHDPAAGAATLSPGDESDEDPEDLPEEPAPDEAAVVPESEFDGQAAVPAPDAEPLPPGAEVPAAGAQSGVPAEEGTTGPALITLRFSEDSWVEMESHGRKLVVGTQTAGSERSVRAEPPVHLLLGNTPGVTLEFRGKPVDLTPYRRGKVARLLLED